MALRFLKCVAVVTLVHALAAALVFGAYFVTRAGGSAPPKGAGQPFVLVGTESAATQVVVHEVRTGESYRTVARAYGVTVQALLEANNRTATEAPRAGERLVIPGRE